MMWKDISGRKKPEPSIRFGFYRHVFLFVRGTETGRWRKGVKMSEWKL